MNPGSWNGWVGFFLRESGETLGGVAFVIGEYMTRAFKKYHRRLTTEEQHLVVNLLIHFHVFGRDLVDKVHLFLGME